MDKYFKARTNPIVDSNNEVRKFVHHLMDITDRKKKQLELEKKERWFNAVFNDPNSFIGVLDTEGNLLKANKKSLEFVGATQDQVKEKKFWNTPWWQHSDEGQRKLQEAVEKASKGEFVRFEVEHHVKDNEKVEVDFSLRPVYKEDEVVKLIAEGRL